jgi:hypothetical protein
MISVLHVVPPANPECEVHVSPFGLNIMTIRMPPGAYTALLASEFFVSVDPFPPRMFNVRENDTAGGVKSSHRLGTGKGRSCRGSAAGKPLILVITDNLDNRPTVV